MKFYEWWCRAFLVERPSLMLGLFRIAVAITVGCHMIPSFLQLPDNYLATAFKEHNSSFFPVWALRLVAQSPDWLVVAFVALFAVSWCGFLIGFQSQPSCILMNISCDYFYALNSLHIGTLSFDILLVTLFLMCVTGYHGDAFSVDSVLRGDPLAYKRPRPFFIQRLLQLQIAWTFWYTALSKITAGGNWLTGNPYHCLMRYPPVGVVRHFPFRDVLAQHPGLCYAIGLVVVIAELTVPLLLFIRKTRPIGLAYGMVFHVLLVVTLHVPTIFFFLFPPQLLLFIEPEQLVEWIEARRARAAVRGRAALLYDGRCGFCIGSVKRLQVLDLFGDVEPVDFHGVQDLTRLHPALTPQRCHSRMQLIEPREQAHRVSTRPTVWGDIPPTCPPQHSDGGVEPSGRLSDGFLAFRRIALRVVLLWPLVPLLYLPGAGWVGQRAYDWIAKRRFLFHRSKLCETNQCRLD